MVLLALLGNRLGLTASGVSEAKIFILLFGGVVLLIGFLVRTDDMGSIRFFGKRLTGLYRAAALIVLNTLVFLVLLELGAVAAWKMRWWLSDTTQAPSAPGGLPFYDLPYYESQNWSAEYWKEWENSLKKRYVPYVLWRRQPFNGTHINVDKDGLRHTPGADSGPGSYKVFVFGGSTVWGTGSPDSSTIPAYLQSYLQSSKEGGVCVVNLGESGFVSTQNLVELMIQLQRGNVPDLVIFYLGANDVYPVYQGARAGLHENIDQIARKLERSPFSQWINGFALTSLVQGGVRRISSGQNSVDGNRAITLDALADSVVDTFSANCRMTQALAHSYGFGCFFFWQPVLLVGEKPLTEEEREMLSRVDPYLVNLYRKVYSRVEQRASEDEKLHYMANVFHKQTEQIWIDPWHVTPVGNRLIANEMVDIICEHMGPGQPGGAHSGVPR